MSIIFCTHWDFFLNVTSSEDDVDMDNMGMLGNNSQGVTEQQGVEGGGAQGHLSTEGPLIPGVLKSLNIN
uniref:Uncharacterized protein n=1 Tax=Heterorhabditis bacteriophora TaxID=37862 RepID=A0A1I7XMR7_HETBA